MFAPIGRRLALLNAVVVVAVIAVASTVTFVLLRQSLDHEADVALAERAEGATRMWADLFTSGQTSPGSDPRVSVADSANSEDGQESAADELAENENEEALLESGDTLLFAVDQNGHVLANARGVQQPQLPDTGSIHAALAGNVDTRSVYIREEPIRVYSVPVVSDNQIVGVVQAARSDREHQTELRLVGVVSLVGVGLGVIVAVPAGLFLARRAMRPIGEAFARQRAFVADASHELRTPLTLMRATTELVQRLPDASPTVRDELAGVIDEIDATGRLVDDLLLLARLDSDELSVRLQCVDLGAVVQSAAASLANLAEAAGLTLTINAASGIAVDADPDRLRQVVRILLDNAIAYTPSPGAVSVNVERQGARARVSVRDTGVGIASADATRVFDRFYRADRARSRATGGTGLGLAIARALVRAHHGEIALESQPGHGTTVWFTVPLVSSSRSKADCVSAE